MVTQWAQLTYWQQVVIHTYCNQGTLLSHGPSNSVMDACARTAGSLHDIPDNLSLNYFKCCPSVQKKQQGKALVSDCYFHWVEIYTKNDCKSFMKAETYPSQRNTDPKQNTPSISKLTHNKIWIWTLQILTRVSNVSPEQESKQKVSIQSHKHNTGLHMIWKSHSNM